MALKEKLQLVDCTLREGEQAAGVWFSPTEKLELAEALAAAGLTILDAAMPAVSAEEASFVEAAAVHGTARIGASVRALRDEVDLALRCGAHEVFVICPVSTLHRERRLGLSEEELLARIRELARAVRDAGRTCNIVAEDASRTEPDQLLRALGCALEAGADVLYLCDTVGVWTPAATTRVFDRVRAAFPGAALGVHCHDDFGMATANTVAAIEAGCRYPTATINGVGERAGNASLLEVAAAAAELLGFDTGLRFDALAELAARVEVLTGIVLPQHQPLVGFNAFRHESGIHVDGLLKERRTYESVAPELVGRSHGLVFGKHSGRAGLRTYARERGWPADDETIDRVLEAIKTRRPSRVRESFADIRRQIDEYNSTCLTIPEPQLEGLFREYAGGAKWPR